MAVNLYDTLRVDEVVFDDSESLSEKFSDQLYFRDTQIKDRSVRTYYFSFLFGDYNNPTNAEEIILKERMDKILGSLSSRDGVNEASGECRIDVFGYTIGAFKERVKRIYDEITQSGLPFDKGLHEIIGMIDRLEIKDRVR
jgi:hypothetical protein